MDLGAKGVIELELVSSGERWGRGPSHDIHSANKARVDSPVWHLVQALHTLVSEDGNDPAIDWVGRQANTSMIYVTHRADELPQSITHVLRLDDGRVVNHSPGGK